MRSTSVSRCSPVCSQKSEKRPKVTHSLGRRAYTMITPEWRGTVCFAVTLALVSIPVAYLRRRKRGPISRLRLHALYCARALVPGLLSGVGIGYLDAQWPYGHEHSPSQHTFRWDLLVLNQA